MGRKPLSELSQGRIEINQLKPDDYTSICIIDESSDIPFIEVHIKYDFAQASITLPCKYRWLPKSSIWKIEWQSAVLPCDNCELNDGCIMQPFTDDCKYATN